MYENEISLHGLRGDFVIPVSGQNLTWNLFIFGLFWARLKLPLWGSFTDQVSDTVRIKKAEGLYRSSFRIFDPDKSAYGRDL